MKSMKITACLLFYQFLVAIDSFSPLSDQTAVKLAELKKDGRIGKCKHHAVSYLMNSKTLLYLANIVGVN